MLHIREHLWLWVAGFSLLGLCLLLLRLATPGAFAFMIVGVVIMLKSQGTDLLAIITEDPLMQDEEPADSSTEALTERAREPVR
ncbi:hypothetical protein ACFQU2_04675 [Siccirubricoccus deserti]